jgi:hypothetical protein
MHKRPNVGIIPTAMYRNSNCSSGTKEMTLNQVSQWVQWTTVCWLWPALHLLPGPSVFHPHRHHPVSNSPQNILVLSFPKYAVIWVNDHRLLWGNHYHIHHHGIPWFFLLGTWLPLFSFWVRSLRAVTGLGKK